MNDIDFDELDKAVGQLMEKRQKRRNYIPRPSEAETKTEPKPEPTSHTQPAADFEVAKPPKISESSDDDKVFVRVERPKVAQNPKRNGKFIDFIPANNPKSLHKSTVKVEVKPPVAQRAAVKKFIEEVEDKMAQRVELKEPKKPDTDIRPDFDKEVDIDKPVLVGSHISLDDEPDLEIRTFKGALESYDDEPEEVEAEIESESEPETKSTPEVPLSPFIEQAKVVKRPLGGPEIGRIDDPSLTPAERSRSVIGDRKTAPVYQAELKLQKKNRAFGWVLWVLFLVALGVGLGYFLFENPFELPLPDLSKFIN